jgi:MSHA biogenesis protein MshM
MYLYHYGFRELPFGLTPDTSFFCELPGHVEALNVLTVALSCGEGFVKITGEVGTGKTLLCRQLLNRFEETHACAYIPNPYLEPQALRFQLATELGLKVPRHVDQVRLTDFIARRLIKLGAAGRPAVLLVDEAQALPDETLEALRLFTNLETEKRKLLQVVLFGQPELDGRLAQPHLRQLRQRITFSYKLQPLNRRNTAAYVEHRMKSAQVNPEQPLSVRFTGGALRALHRCSRGVPRLINVLAHKALMLGYGEQTWVIRQRHIRKAAQDTDDVRWSWTAWLPGGLL